MTQKKKKSRLYSRARPVLAAFVFGMASDLATSAEEAREERVLLRLFLPTPPAARRRRPAVVVISEVVRIDPAPAAAVAVRPGLRLGVRDERQSLLNGRQRHRRRRRGGRLLLLLLRHPVRTRHRRGPPLLAAIGRFGCRDLFRVR